MDSEIYFEVKAVNGIIVRRSREYWHKIISFKHPSMTGMEDEVDRIKEGRRIWKR
jgi:hypothetical protein